MYYFLRRSDNLEWKSADLNAMGCRLLATYKKARDSEKGENWLGIFE